VACFQCGKRFNSFTGTLFAHTRMSCRQIVVMLLLLRVGKRNCEVAKWAKVSPATALRWRDILVAHGAELGQRTIDADDLLPRPGSREHSP
jgi:transposase-like protein